MPDTSSILRLAIEMLWSMRREGLRIATSQAIDCVRAVEAVGIEDRTTLRDAFSAVLSKSQRDREIVNAVFARFFDAPRKTLWERLAEVGFSSDELDALRNYFEYSRNIEMLAAWSVRGADLDRLLSLVSMDEMQGPLQAGFYAHRVLEQAGHPRAKSELRALRLWLRDALGERGDALADALASEIEEAAREIREDVKKRATPRDFPASMLGDKPFIALDPREVEEVRRAVRSFAARLRGRERTRKKHAARGRIDPHRALRSAMRTGGVPFVIPRRRKRRDKPELLVLCDISDSVRRVATFLLEFVHVTHELFDRTRSFVFVSDLGETTKLFQERGLAALPIVYGGGVIPVSSNSSYGRALRAFAEEEITKRTTVVILGDGRTNYGPDGADALESIASRAGSVLWLCPEPRTQWGTGDSAMAKYMHIATETLSVSTARELETSARRIVARR